MESARGKYGGGGGSTVGSVRLGGRLYLGFVFGSVLGSAANFFPMDFERQARSTTFVGHD